MLLSTASAARADIVTDWMDYGLKVEGETNRTQDNAPANSQLGAAMFEADNARLIAKVYIVDYDEGLAMIDAKMYYQVWRPITAIRNADADGNSETPAEPGWVPLISTPNHPEYRCGYCGSAAAMADVIKAEVGDTPRGGVEITSKSITDAVPMRTHGFDAWVKEVSYSRTLGGVHYRFSNEARQELGHRAAAAATGLIAALDPGAKARNHWRR